MYEQIATTITNLEIMKNADEFDSFVRALDNLDGDAKERLAVKNPPNQPPSSSLEALIARQKAFRAKFHTHDKLYAEWQNYWLNCCLSSKCDRLFSILVNFNVDREEDMLEIMRRDNTLLWENIPVGGQVYYLNTALSFLLQRFSYITAWKFWCQHGRCRWGFGLLSLFLPRLFGAIVVGLILLVPSSGMWELPTRLLITWCCGWVLLLLMFMLSFGYLLYDCRKRVESKCRAGFKDILDELVLRRTLPIMALGGVESFLINYLIVIRLFLPAFQVDHAVFLYPPSLWVTCATFTVEALFIGIFMYVFWGEKSAAEPL